MNKPWKILANELEEFQDAERRMIEVETSEHLADRELESLFKLREFDRIESVCRKWLDEVRR